MTALCMEYVKKPVVYKDLNQQEAAEVMEAAMEGKLTSAQIASFLTALTMKGETAEEITGMARVMRAKSRKVRAPADAVDTCGTGGDGLGTFNVSTTAALITAGAGVSVVKHGNRSVTSRCGSADLLEALGVNVEMEPREALRCLEYSGFTFLFAPLYHQAMRHASAPRREIGFRTAFNLLGPLTNPAGVGRQVIGVPHPSLVELLAEVCSMLEAEHVLVVHGGDGSDELSLEGENLVMEVRRGKIRQLPVDLRSLGFSLPGEADSGDLRGGSPEVNAAITRKVLAGHRCPAREMALLNAAAALLVSGKVESLEHGVELAREAVEEGGAERVLEKLYSAGR